MKNKNMLFFLFLLSVFCCNKTDNGTLPVIDVLGPTSGSIENLSDIADDIKYILLETTPKTLIGFIGKLVVTSDGNFYVVEPSKLKVTGFDPMGNFLDTLHKEGRGPGEYTGILDFDISDDGRYIFALGSKIDIYEINGGKFDYIKTIQFDNPAKPSNIELISKSNKLVLPYGSSLGTEPYRCLILGFENDTLGYRPNYYRYEKQSNITFARRTENIIYEDGDNVYLYNDLSDTVFRITGKNEFLPHMILKTNGKLMSVKEKIDLSALIDNYSGFIGRFVMFGRLFESERYVYGLYDFENQKHAFIFDKENQQKYRVDGMKFFTDDLSGGINFEPKYYNNGFVYSWVDAITLKNHVASDEFKNSVPKIPEKRQQLVELTDNLEETDNPVLVVVKLKK
jgi:hypothetical protein